MLTDTDIKKMQVLYKKHFGIDLDKDTARAELSLLVRQMELVYVPISAKQLEALQDEDNKANAGNEDVGAGSTVI